MTTMTVRDGDTLGAIAARFGTTVDALAAANGIPDPDVIRVGQVLVIPGDNGDDGQIDPGQNGGEAIGIPERFARWIPLVQAAADRFDVEPAIIMGIIAVESNGENVIGDFGHGRGLMQIDDRSFGDWLATHDNGLNPATNIMKGAEILRGNINFFDGDIRNGVSAFNAGPGNVQAALQQTGDPDQFTTGGNYSVKVLGHADEFRAGGLA